MSFHALPQPIKKRRRRGRRGRRNASNPVNTTPSSGGDDPVDSNSDGSEETDDDETIPNSLLKQKLMERKLRVLLTPQEVSKKILADKVFQQGGSNSKDFLIKKIRWESGSQVFFYTFHRGYVSRRASQVGVITDKIRRTSDALNNICACAIS